MSLPPELLAVCSCSSRRGYVVELIAQTIRRRHTAYRTDPLVTFIEAKEAHRRLGNGYRRVLDLLFETHDDYYCPAEGIAKAYRLRPLAFQVLCDWLDYLPGPQPPSPGESGVYSPVVRVDRLRDYAGDLDGWLETHRGAPRPLTEEQQRELYQGTAYCLFTHALLRRVEPIGPGLALLFERYQRKSKEGRRFVQGLGLQHAPKKVRLLALGGLGYWLVDIRNAHPEIVNQLTSGRHRMLATYCSHRDETLDELAEHYGCSRSAVKDLLLKLLYGASLTGKAVREWRREHTDNPWKHHRFVTAYRQDVEAAGLEIRESHPEVKGPTRKLLARIIQRYEDKVLRACEAFHTRRNEEVVLLLFDGYAVHAPVDVEELSAWVLAWTGFDLRFTCEPIGEPPGPLTVRPLEHLLALPGEL